MNKTLKILFLIAMVSCEEKPEIKLSDLDRGTDKVSEITLFIDDLSTITSEFDFENYVIPPHAKTLAGREKLLLHNHCQSYPNYRFCYVNFFDRNRIKISAYRGDTLLHSVSYEGDKITPLFGAPPPVIFKVVQFSPHTFVISHSFGESIFHKTRFCLTFTYGGRLFYGLDESNKLLFFSSPLQKKLKHPLPVWREYDPEKNCTLPGGDWDAS